MLCQQVLDDPSVDVGEPEVSSLVLERQLGVVNSEQMQSGRVEITHMHGVLGRLEPEVVSGSIRQAGPDPPELK